MMRGGNDGGDDDDDGDDGDDARAKSLRFKLELTSARALRALEEKDATIVNLRAALAKYENGSHLSSERENDPRGGGWSFKAWSQATSDKENHAVAVDSERSSRQHKALEKSLEEERARVIDLRRQLREANLHASKLQESHEAARRFALENEHHAERLGDAVKRVSSARENFLELRESATIALQRNLSAQVSKLTAQSHRFQEECEHWKSKVLALEEALEITKHHVDALDADDDTAESSSVQNELKRLRVKLIETQLALQEALDDRASKQLDGGTEAKALSRAGDFDAVIQAINAQQEDIRIVTTIESRLKSLQLEVKELRTTNRAQVNDLERLENSLREQLTLNRATLDASEIAADATSREKARLQSLLRDREDDILILRDTVAALESDRAPRDEEWRQREIGKTREKCYALESENTRLQSQCEILTGEALRLRHDLSVETGRAEMFENISNASKVREEILTSQLDIKSEECCSYMEAELALLYRLEEVEHSRAAIEVKLAACEKSLLLQAKRFDDTTSQKLDVLKQSIIQSVSNSSAHVDRSASFCHSIRSCLQTSDGANEQVIEAVLAAQRTIVRLECDALSYESAFSLAMRYISKTEHRASSMKTAFDHVCAILALSQTSHASLKSIALASLEARLTATRARNTKLVELLLRGESQSSGALDARDVDDELFERDEEIRAARARIEELEVMSSELIGAREAAANAMQSMSVARDKAKKEFLDEQDRARELGDTISLLKSEIIGLKEQSEIERNDVKALRHALVVSEAEANARFEIAEDNVFNLQQRYDDVVEQLGVEREQLRMMSEKLVVHGEEESMEIRHQETAFEDARVAAVVAAAARQDAEASKLEIERLQKELAHREDHPFVQSELEKLSASIENSFSAHALKLDEIAQMYDVNACTAQAFTDVVTARLLNLEAEIAEQRKREEEWLSSSVPSADEKKAHVERCQRYRDIMRRMQDEHVAERDRLLMRIKEAEFKIAELSKVYENSRLGLTHVSPPAPVPQEHSEKHEIQGEEPSHGGNLRELEDAKAQLVAEKARRRREIARHEDEVEKLRESVAAYAIPALALADAVRLLSVLFVRVSAAAIAHETHSSSSESFTQNTHSRNTTTDVANIVGLSVDDLNAVFEVENVQRDERGSSSVEDVITALSMKLSPSNVHAAIAWCEQRVDSLSATLKSAEMWRGDALEAIVALVQSQSTFTESILRRHEAVARWLEELDSL